LPGDIPPENINGLKGNSESISIFKARIAVMDGIPLSALLSPGIMVGVYHAGSIKEKSG
jgi:hypothetical protein